MPTDGMREALAVVCRDLRGASSRTQIAARVNRGEQSVARFEQGIGKWNPQTGQLVEAYADLAGSTRRRFGRRRWRP